MADALISLTYAYMCWRSYSISGVVMISPDYSNVWRLNSGVYVAFRNFSLSC